MSKTDHIQVAAPPPNTATNWWQTSWLHLCYPTSCCYNCYSFTQKYAKQTSSQPWDRSQTKPLKNSHLDQDVAKVWSRHVSPPWVPGTTRRIKIWFLVSGTPPMPHWGWRHNRKNYTLYECLSPSVYYKNHRAPTLPWLSENRPEQSVKRGSGKSVMTTSSSIWLSVGRLVAQGETERAKKEKEKRGRSKNKGLCCWCRWVFFIFLFNISKECVVRLSEHVFSCSSL